MNARLRVNPAVRQSFEPPLESSHTLQHSATGHTAAPGARLAEAGVQTIAGASVPRLARTLALP